jgi:type II secretory pathway component PulF
MNRIATVLAILGSGVAVVLVGAVVFHWGGVLVLLLVGAIYVWIPYSYFHYRYIRQQELLNLLLTAAEAGSPVGPALWAYLDDRPRGGIRDAWASLVLFFMRHTSFDLRLERLALLLESGAPLADALRETPGVASRDTQLAAAVGESTGRLAACLRLAPRWRLGTVWVEAVPRLLYPLALLACLSAVMTFLMLFVAPKFEKIFADFKMKLPEPTQHVMGVGRFVTTHGGYLGLAVLGAVALGLLLSLNSVWRWYFPGLGRLYRMHVQSRVLRMLGLLLEAHRPLPEALAVLADSEFFAGVAQRRLRAVRAAILQGEPLAPSLQRQGLLPTRMVALVQAAERARNLPWALAELGDLLGQRTVRILRRLTMAIAPAAVLVAGIFVGYVALAWFLPLIKLITEMA